MEINKTELVNFLMGVEKFQPVYVVMETPVRMNKTGNPYYGRVTKRTSGNFFIGVDYENRVNNNMSKEEMERTFETEKPKGKTHISKVLLIDDKTNSVHYVMLEYFKEVPPKVEFFIEGGDPIEKQLFESYLVKHYDSQKQEQERKVVPITPKLSNIRVLHIDNMKYEIIPEVVTVEVEE
jgi:hypothetical protein